MLIHTRKIFSNSTKMDFFCPSEMKKSFHRLKFSFNFHVVVACKKKNLCFSHNKNNRAFCFSVIDPQLTPNLCSFSKYSYEHTEKDNFHLQFTFVNIPHNTSVSLLYLSDRKHENASPSTQWSYSVLCSHVVHIHYKCGTK